ncbi:MAG: cation:proton antiporter regulatory subunit [Actinomycetota bacterium]|nr:cation:proton antiporter regulatory subunit [Actinomycetota bacterium]
MTEIKEVKLPGLGVRYEFITQEGKRVGVVSHRSGRKELYFAHPHDPDTFKRMLGLSDKDARTLAEMLRGSRVAEELAELQHRIEGLAIDWLPLRDDSPYVGRTIGDARIRSRTGVSVVAVLRDDQAIAAPGPELDLDHGDYLVVVGTPRGIEEVVELLRGG